MVASSTAEDRPIQSARSRASGLSVAAFVCLFTTSFGLAQPSGGRERDKDQRGRLLADMTAFKTDVPKHAVNVILARPTDRSITVSIAAESAKAAVVEYWTTIAAKKIQTQPIALSPGIVGLIELNGLTAGTEYGYRVGLIRDDAAAPDWGEEARFRTRPPPGTPAGFSFVIQADSHLDQGVEPKVYEQTLKNMLNPPDGAPRPDFLIDLGDTFMTDKRGKEFESALPQYDAQRYYFGLVAHSAPLFMVLGNHDGEKGTSGRGDDDIGPWSYRQRTSRFPPPRIDGDMYTGATTMNDGVGSNYYAFEWGDALFIMLDPFWSTTDRIRGGGGNRNAAERGAPGPGAEPLSPTDASWASTLGHAQHQWLEKTLASTRAKFRFVFIHHLVGGRGGAESRGGVESSRFFEWGGDDADGNPAFARRRPGWSMPIHDLLVAHRVSAVFHGHDHLYVHAQRDGLHYQCVPQPGNPSGNTRTAGRYGYASGEIHGSPGHIRVRVTPTEAVVEFIRSATPDAAGRRPKSAGNGEVVDRYRLAPIAQP